mmetsp:Transcript_11493/g.38382  ORF Transcript_11493/g.38382 Transcript_11493/m.38382 type:complete len:232 (-) Transcript_11493:175-870(-)
MPRYSLPQRGRFAKARSTSVETAAPCMSVASSPLTLSVASTSAWVHVAVEWYKAHVKVTLKDSEALVPKSKMRIRFKPNASMALLCSGDCAAMSPTASTAKARCGDEEQLMIISSRVWIRKGAGRRAQESTSDLFAEDMYLKASPTESSVHPLRLDTAKSRSSSETRFTAFEGACLKRFAGRHLASASVTNCRAAAAYLPRRSCRSFFQFSMPPWRSKEAIARLVPLRPEK